MADPDTTLTDIALALLCAMFALALAGESGPAALYALLFGALGLAALTGGLWHGWHSDRHRGFGGALWLATMVAVGVANVALWWLAGMLAGAPLLIWIAFGQFAAYVALLALATRAFWLASAFTLPPILALAVVFSREFLRDGGPGYGFGLAAVALALGGAVLQAAKIGLPALRLGHNALYHMVQALAFTLLFLGLPGA